MQFDQLKKRKFITAARPRGGMTAPDPVNLGCEQAKERTHVLLLVVREVTLLT